MLLLSFTPGLIDVTWAKRPFVWIVQLFWGKFSDSWKGLYFQILVSIETQFFCLLCVSAAQNNCWQIDYWSSSTSNCSKTNFYPRSKTVVLAKWLNNKREVIITGHFFISNISSFSLNGTLVETTPNIPHPPRNKDTVVDYIYIYN